jgi:hypothetical protein
MPSVACVARRVHICPQMDNPLINKLVQSGALNEHYILASLLWGTIAGGYMIYGWKQQTLIPFLGGLVMTAITFFIFSALWLSLASIVIMFGVWWLCKQGY